MYFDYTSSNAILANVDDETRDEITAGYILECLANSIDITFNELRNEGYPVYYGNDYAVYEFTAFIHGSEYLYSLNDKAIDELREYGSTILFPRECLDAVEFVQMTPCDFDMFGCECYKLEWNAYGMAYEYDGIQERPITPNVTHVYDVNQPAPVFVGAIDTSDDEEYYNFMAQLVNDYLNASTWTPKTMRG